MRRGFLFGIGTFLIIGTLAGLLEVWKGGTLDIVVGALMIATCAPMSVLAIRKANEAQPDKSWLHAFAGWLIGFCVVNAATFLVFFWLVPLLGQ
jgi:hypothetical protein